MTTLTSTTPQNSIYSNALKTTTTLNTNLTGSTIGVTEVRELEIVLPHRSQP